MAFSQASMLIHFDPQKRLFADLDSSGKGIGAMIYHSDKDPPSQKSSKPILFLSRLWKPAETRYWPTEMEVAGLCWVVRKIRHLFESSKNPTVIFTDHSAALQIATQSSINTTSLIRMNMRHVRSSEYLNRFPLESRYKAGKINVVPDALSRLDVNTADKRASIEQLAFPISIVEIGSDFKQRIQDSYKTDVRCKTIFELLANNNELDQNSADLPFEIQNDILYAKPDEMHDRRRPVIPKSLQGEVFRQVHDNLGHIGFDRIHERLSNNFFLFNFTKALKAYLWHCRECQLNRTPRHRPFGSLQPILTPPFLFHTISIDFILALPKTPLEEWDVVMTVTDKLSKAITILPGKSNWTAEEWGIALIYHLLYILWGLPRAIISDRDRKFTSSMWRGIFSKLNVNLLFSTSWHPQTDGASERTNQQIEIAMRYLCACLENLTEWPKILPTISATFSNSTSRGTGRTATEVMYGQRIKEPLDIAADAMIDLEQNNLFVSAFPAATYTYNPARIEAIDAIKMAAIVMKKQYDAKHLPKFFNVGDYVSLRLHRGFNVPGLAGRNKKIEQQFAGPFRVLERVGKLAYRIDLPPSMNRIHPVISVAHLEPAPHPLEDPYNRPFSQTNIETLIPEKILNKRQLRRRNGGNVVEYLVRYKNRSVEWDNWISQHDLDEQLIKDYEHQLT